MGHGGWSWGGERAESLAQEDNPKVYDCGNRMVQFGWQRLGKV